MATFISRVLPLKNFFKDPNKKGGITMLKEIFQYGWAKKEWPTDYFRKFLYRREITDITSYLSLNEYFSIINSKKILVRDLASILDNKLSFSLFANQYQLPTPKIFSYNIKTNFYFNSNYYHITNDAALLSFFDRIFRETHESQLFIKPISGIGGKGCILIKKESLEEQIRNYGTELLLNNFIHQEKINQHDSISKIHSNSVNTMRINTFLDKQGKCNVISALMRFGSGNLITDNESSGGFFIGIDLETETLKGQGKQSMEKGALVHDYHPDSKILLHGLKIPFIKESLQLVKQAAILIPTRIIGWDIAITPQGPLIIEGNSNTSLHMADVAYGGLCKLPIVQQILKEIND